MITDEENKLILDNISIAHAAAWKYYKKFNKTFELEELQSLAFLGLTKSAKTFKPELGFTFSTYAYKCIQNEILIHNRKYNKENTNLISLNSDIGDDMTLEDVIADNSNILNNLDNNQYLDKLHKEINNLPERYKYILINKLKGKTMVSIGEELGICQPQVSRDYNKALNILRNKFKGWEVI